MKKETKLYIMFICTLISALLVPIFTQWYEQQTGKSPMAFMFVLILGGFLLYIAAFTNNFKDM
jgi:uncharacterized membrane protein